MNDKQVAGDTTNTSSSHAYYQRAARVLPGGVSYALRDVPPRPFYVHHASGAHLHDVDGRVYTDYWCGHGALFLGHAPAGVIEAVTRQLARGTHFGFCHPLEVELAELVVEMLPSAEMLRFTNSGTEANMYAIGLARGFTGRLKIAKAEGGWHGGCEALQKAVHAPYTTVEAAGLNPKALDDTLVFGFNDLDSARRAIVGQELACVVVEPVLGAAGFIPPEPGFLEGLRILCDQTGTLLVFDEVVTGFRLGPGGAQQLFGVTPDITIIGKIMGGGFSIGALCGRRDVFARLDQRLFRDLPERVFHGGTFSANPVSMAAGLATLTELGAGTAYQHVNRLGARVRSGLEAIFQSSGVEAAVTGLGSLVSVHFRKGKPRNAREAAASDTALARAYHDFMLKRGIVYLTPAVPHMFISAAHTEQDITELLSASEEFAGTLR